MKPLTDDQIEAIKAMAKDRLGDFIGSHVKLTQKGRNWVGLCPFHNERTPSFTVTPHKAVYKCFGCGKSGRDAITFIKDLRGLSFIDACRYIANHYNILL